MPFDRSTAYGQRVEQRLQDEQVIWLTTVTPGGQPLPVPIWFLWDGQEEVLIYSRPNTPKLRNIANHPKVALNFNSDDTGGNIIQFDGEARLDPDAPLATGVEPYIEKYRIGIGRLGTTPEGFAADYSAAIRVRLSKVRGY